MTAYNVKCNHLKAIKYFKGSKITIRNYGKISIGAETILSTINPIGTCNPYLSLICLSGASLEIGNNTGISNSTIVARDKIVIGNDVMIGADCKIYDNDFHSIDFRKRVNSKDTTIKTSPVIINDGAFIGAHCIILKGTVIGKRAVIGAGSVVAGKVIGDDEIWAGNPCCFIKKINQQA